MTQHRTISPPLEEKLGAGSARKSRRRASRPLLALGLALLAGLALSIRPPAAAAATLTFQVTTTTDAPDASPGDGICADAAGQCTLRAAVQEADAQPSGSTITILVPAGTFPLKLGVLSLTANTITVQGTGATTVDGRNASQVFNIGPAASVTLGQLAIIDGNASLGGGIQNAGTLTLTNSTVAASVANNGGGIYNQQGATLALAGTTVSQNVAGRDGGGIANNGGTLQLSLSTVAGNKASLAGGGIVDFFGTVSVSQSTIAGNAATGRNSEGGGGIANGDGTLTVDKSTISGNSTSGGTGGSAIFNILTTSVSNSTISGNTGPGHSVLNSDTLTLSYVTIASNSAGISNSGSVTATGTIIANNNPGTNCFGNRFNEPFGFNLDSGTSCRLSQATDLTGTDPLLGPLASNGGPTQTQALEAGSPAIDHGGTSANGCPPTDQRGVTRPQGPACDIGAFEFVP